MKNRKMTGRVDGEGERSLSSCWGPQQSCRGCCQACGGGEGSEAAEGVGYDDDGGVNCSQQGRGLHDRCDRSEDVGLPRSDPAEIL